MVLEEDPFLLETILRGKLLVVGRVYIYIYVFIYIKNKRYSFMYLNWYSIFPTNSMTHHDELVNAYGRRYIWNHHNKQQLCLSGYGQIEEANALTA